jgi:Tfp pilus assembly protein PilF
MSILDQLITNYEADSTDPFNLYALAIEYLKHNRQESERLFEILLTKHPQYLPTYYHAAKLYEDNNETQKARKTYEDGLLVARANQKPKLEAELKAAFQNFLFENDL